jgi:pSer/pThr/pTyr-binding forkhead associated (FHA) protein
MAMILEVVHPNGTRTLHRLGQLPLSVGRALSNDLVLDDPYVDGRHASISVDEYGGTLIEDLGSVNGLISSDHRLYRRMPVRPGLEIRVGRTLLRFRDADEPVAPALADDSVAPRPPPARAAALTPTRVRRARAFATTSRWAATTWARLLAGGAAVLAMAIYSWLGSSERSSKSEAFFAALTLAFMIAIWAGIWAVASRVSVQRFHFVGHVAVASVISLGGLLWTMFAEWVTFFFPDAGIAEVMSAAIGLLLLVALVAGHLSLASAMPRKRRWRAGFAVAGVALVIVGLATLTEEESFTDVPTFSGVVKPVASEWVPTATVEEFGGVMARLKEEVDEMAKQ